MLRVRDEFVEGRLDLSLLSHNLSKLFSFVMSARSEGSFHGGDGGLHVVSVSSRRSLGESRVGDVNDNSVRLEIVLDESSSLGVTGDGNSHDDNVGAFDCVLRRLSNHFTRSSDDFDLRFRLGRVCVGRIAIDGEGRSRARRARVVRLHRYSATSVDKVDASMRYSRSYGFGVVACAQNADSHGSQTQIELRKGSITRRDKVPTKQHVLAFSSQALEVSWLLCDTTSSPKNVLWQRSAAL